MKIGIFGGSFDPPHCGHIYIAQAARRQFQLDRLVMVPAGRPPHKRHEITPPQHRLAMCRLVAREFGFRVSDYEIKKEEFCYTADTLAHFRQTEPDAELFFIVGGDSVDYMDAWKEPERIFSLCRVLAAPRRGTQQNKIKTLRETYKADIALLDCTYVDISSTNIRERMGQKQEIAGLVTEKVAGYIRQNNLYR